MFVNNKIISSGFSGDKQGCLIAGVWYRNCVATLKLRMPDREMSVVLGDATLRPFLGALRLVSPELAVRLEDAAFRDYPVDVDEREIELLASAAQRVRQSPPVEDPELEQMDSCRRTA
jgi:hypothetical protein